MIASMSDRPVGTVTFPFTDMEGSTRACEQFPTETRAALQRHDQIMAEQVEAHGRAIIIERGDSVFAVFARPSDAVTCAYGFRSRRLRPRERVPSLRRIVCSFR
ncbi:MAG: hypothetical protein DME38_09905 [Verrucomicrobia bacterium]|nr:MAG: hypothetical protein DME38_09905 [Verrucomicrobiota bacterium]